MNNHFSTRHSLISRFRYECNDTLWGDFVELYRPYINTVISRMGVPRDDLDDVVQTILLTLWKKLPDFNYEPAKCKFRTWLNVITRNIVLAYFRKRDRYHRKINKATLVQVETSNPEIAHITEDEWKLHISTLAWENVKSCFEGKTIECFLLFSKGESISSICHTLVIKENTAYVFRRRVMDKLCREIRRLNSSDFN